MCSVSAIGTSIAPRRQRRRGARRYRETLFPARGGSAFGGLLRFCCCDSALEPLDATGSVDGLGSAGVERERSGRDFHLEERVFFAVLPLVGFFRVDS